MCTSPNFLAYKYSLRGKDENGRMVYTKRFRFIPGSAHQYEALRYDRVISIPCGQCLECKIAYAQSWADRCVIESKQWKQNYFITLTYDDRHIENNSLNPKHLTDFIKRVREHFGANKENPIRYFACGEYGGTTLRRHLHIIFFNLPLTDLTYLFKTKVYDSPKDKIGRLESIQMDVAKDNMYSPIIHKLWQYQGNITVSSFNWNKAAYIARYCTGKIDKHLQDWYKETGKVPEFVRMSTCPGIGANGYDPEKMIYSDSFVVDGTGKLSFHPRYYEKLFVKQFGELHPQIELRKTERQVQSIVNESIENRNRNAEYFHRNYKLMKRHIINSKV